MKLDFKIVLLFLVFLSCKENDNNGKVVYNQDEYLKLWMKDKNVKVKVVDTFCENQTKKAIKDIANNQLTYFNPYAYYEHEELAELLKKHGIQTKICYRPCISVASFNLYCYQDLMKDEIEKRYGKTFLDSLWQIAEKKFVLKYPDSLYIKEGRDIREKYIPVKKQ